jgi:hypothetical protein
MLCVHVATEPTMKQTFTSSQDLDIKATWLTLRRTTTQKRLDVLDDGTET